MTAPESRITSLRSLLSSFFLPDEPDLEERARRKLFTIFMLLLGLPLLAFGIYHLRNGIYTYGAMDFILAVVMIGLAFAQKRISRAVFLYRGITLLLWLLLFYWLKTTAMNGYASIWAIITPVFSFFLLGKREGFVWTLAMVGLCVFFFFNPFGLDAILPYSTSFSVRHLGTLLFVFFLTYFYESTRLRYKKALEQEREELRNHRDNLEIMVAERTEEISSKNIELKNTLEQLRVTTTHYLESQKEKEQMQEQLAHSQKMEALGTLVGGFAHNFNNLLSGITGCLNFLEVLLKNEHLERRTDIDECLKLGIESSQKSAIIIRQLLTLSRRQDFNLAPTDLRQSLNNTLSILKSSLPKSIRLDFHVPEQPTIVMAEPVYIEQVLLNLCINASHAMTIMRDPDETQGGTLTVITEVVAPGESIQREFPKAAGNGSWTRIRVIDNGVGIPEESRARIFEPFYTTKNTGGGSGLGLAISYGIIRQHGGFISVDERPGGGSVFSVFLPLAGDQAPSRHDFPVSQVHDVPPRRETILVIDDEPFILYVIKGYLEEFGWEAIITDKPEEGISIFRERREDISAVILDLSMPGKSGIEVYGELSAMDPAVKVVLCSGLIESEVTHRALSAGISKILYKPFESGTLLDTLLDLLNHR
ncbi:MAG: response regulator [Spirochaetes bacterium]|nr:response regulator [Spirochaetota bacterium]